MQFLSTLALSILAAATLSHALNKPPQQPEATIESKFVEKLSEKTFDEFLKSNKVSLVEYYAPWCGHCRQLAPEFVKAAEELEKDGIKLAQVDCTLHQELCKDIRGYPTMKIYKNGNHSLYEGQRNSEVIVKQIQPAVASLAGDKLGTFTKSDDVVLVGYFQPGSAEEKEFAKVAEKLRNELTFGSVKAPSVVMYKKFDEGFVPFEGKITEEALSEFIATESVPLMAEIGPENYMKYFESKMPLAFFFYGDDEQRSKIGPQIEAAVKEFRGKMNAVYIKASQFGQHAEALNLAKEWPAFAVHNMEKDLKYPFSGKEMTKETVGKFISGVLSGDIKPTFKSEPVPEKDDGPVKTLVHDNFDQIVFSGKKDVLVEFYAPWCGACKNLAPIYEKLASKYAKLKNGDSLVIAKMDAVANDLPSSLSFEIRAYPTIKFFKAGSKEPVDFDGEHSLKAFVDFLNSNSSKLSNIQLEKAEIEEEETRQQKLKDAREKQEKARKEAAEKATQEKKEESASKEESKGSREEL